MDGLFDVFDDQPKGGASTNGHQKIQVRRDKTKKRHANGDVKEPDGTDGAAETC